MYVRVNSAMISLFWTYVMNEYFIVDVCEFITMFRSYINNFGMNFLNIFLKNKIVLCLD